MLLFLMMALGGRAESGIYFTDVTEEADIFFRHMHGGTGKRHFIETMGPGIAFLDYDGDGYLDIYAVNGQYTAEPTAAPATNVLYRNNGDGTFADVALMAGVGYNEDGKTESSMGVDFGDYDNDGVLDLIIPNFQGETCTLYHNEGDGFFLDVSASRDRSSDEGLRRVGHGFFRLR